MNVCNLPPVPSNNVRFLYFAAVLRVIYYLYYRHAAGVFFGANPIANAKSSQHCLLPIRGYIFNRFPARLENIVAVVVVVFRTNETRLDQWRT